MSNCVDSRKNTMAILPAALLIAALFLSLSVQAVQLGTCSLGASSIPYGETVHRLLEREENVTAVDICFVVSMKKTMSHRWVQNLALRLDNLLLQRGIGNASNEQSRNRFCLVQFGGRTHNIFAKFVMVNNKIFFNSTTEAKIARTMLNKHGYVADGYEALEFAINNTPFRTGNNISRSIILGSDTGRDLLSNKIYLNRKLLSQKLKEKRITLDVVVNMSVEVEGAGNSTVLGLQSYRMAVVTEGAGSKTIEGNIQVTNSQGTTLSDYVALAFEMGGTAWTLDNLSGRTLPALGNVAAAYISTRPYLQLHLCEACSCVNTTEGGSVLCEQPFSHLGCTMCINSTMKECSLLLQKSGLGMASSQLVIKTRLISQSGSSATIGFHSNRGDVSFRCSHINTTWPTTTDHSFWMATTASVNKRIVCIKTSWGIPACCRHEKAAGRQQAKKLLADSRHGSERVINTTSQSIGTSPIQFNNLTEGKHLFIVEGQTVDGVSASRAVNIFVQSSADTHPTNINISNAILDDNADYATVAFHATSSTNDSISYFCSVASSAYHPCTSPYRFSVQSLQLLLKVIGISSEGNYVVGIAKKVLNFTNSIGPLKIVTSQEVISGNLLEIRYATTRQALCFCLGQGPAALCSKVPGLYQLDIIEQPNTTYIKFACRTTIGTDLTTYKTVQFVIPCCPRLQSVNVTATGSLVKLSMAGARGNCSNSDAYNYHISWGDGATISGTDSNITQTSLHISRQFSSTGTHHITTKLCSASSPSPCCDILMSTVIT